MFSQETISVAFESVLKVPVPPHRTCGEIWLIPAACVTDTHLLVVLKVNMPDCLQLNKFDECIVSL